MAASRTSFKPGNKGGPGRPKGAIAKRSEAMTKALGEEGYDPQSLIRLGFEIARDPKAKHDTRVHAIGTVLPYMLPRMSAIEVTGGKDGAPVRIRIIRDETKK